MRQNTHFGPLKKYKTIKKIKKFHKMTRDMYGNSVNVNLRAEIKFNLCK